MNSGWLTKSDNACPLGKLDDGMNDVTLISTETMGGRCSLIRYLLNLDTGDYFNANGQLNPNLGMHYLKTSSWELDPHVKANPPAEVAGRENFFLDPNYEYNDNALFSIDGERYKSQKLTAVVRPRFLPVYM